MKKRTKAKKSVRSKRLNARQLKQVRGGIRKGASAQWAMHFGKSLERLKKS